MSEGRTVSAPAISQSMDGVSIQPRARHEVRYCTVIHLHGNSLEYLFIFLRTVLRGYGLQCFSYEGDSPTSIIL
jgi:hypothetical protein